MPGRAFTRGMYSRLKLRDTKGRELKPHHHIWLDKQFIADCKMWWRFLESTYMNICRPFVDFNKDSTRSVILSLYSDASRNTTLGMGAVFLEEHRWLVMQWPEGFVQSCQPSIEYLELYALVAAILSWNDSFWLNNQRVTVFCDNEAVVYMVNNNTSSCMQCMKLVRILALDSINCNRRLFALHVKTGDNFLQTH